MNRAIFLDRDGVINSVAVRHNKPYSPRRFEQFKIIDGINETLLRFRAAGFLNIVVTNQPDIARQLMSEEQLEKMHEVISKELAVDDILVCPHDDSDRCSCRKPKPGMLIEAARRWAIKLSDSYIVGDTWKDVQAGKNVGCRTVLIKTSYNTQTDADFKTPNLASACEAIIEADRKVNYDCSNRYIHS